MQEENRWDSKENIDTVKEYLKNEFNGFDIDNKYDFDRIAQTFRIAKDSELYILKIGRDFFDVNSTVKIQTILKRQEIAKQIRKVSPKKILLKSKELQILD